MEPSSLFVARKEGEAIGFCYVPGDRVNALYVEPYVGLDVGTQLLAASIGNPRKLVGDIFVSVVPGTQAVNFYRRRGFQPSTRNPAISHFEWRGGQHLPLIEMVLPADSELTI